MEIGSIIPESFPETRKELAINAVANKIYKWAFIVSLKNNPLKKLKNNTKIKF